jgi:putative nucleotidyltransferase with HDIG domain
MIGKSLELDIHMLCLTETAGLLHDIGRFEQYNRFKTFADSVSVNHAELGVRILEKNKVLIRYPENDQNSILKAILYHNRGTLPSNENDDIIFLTKIIRDADKLDIWRVFIEHNKLPRDQQHSAVDLDLPDTETFSEKALADLMARKIVDYRHIVSKNDFALMRLGWVYDINFNHTYQEIARRDYLSSLKKSLPKEERINAAFKEARSYVNEKIRDHEQHV